MASEPSQISEREREILRLVAMGATNQQIAHQLNISINTVKVHLRNIFGKIGVVSRTEATVYAIRTGLISVENSALSPATADMTTDAEPALLAPDQAPTLPGVTLAGGGSPPALLEPIVRSNGSSQAPAERNAVDVQALPHVPFRRRLLIMLATIIVVLSAALAYTLFQQRQQILMTPTPGPAVAEGDRWKSRAPLAQPRSDFAVAAYEGKLYVIGGTGAAGTSAVVERYDPANDLWVPLGDKPTAVTHVQAVTVGGRIYVPGGEGKNGEALSVFEAYDPRRQQWESLPPLPVPRSRYALADIEGRIYLLGGWDGSGYRAEVFAYDPQGKTWSARTPLPTPRRNAGAAVVEEHVYVIGGENASGPLRVNERYDPNSSGGGQWDSRAPLPAAMGTPAVAGMGSAGLWVFDPRTRTGLQYDPNKDAWIPLSIRDGIAFSTRVVPLSTSIFVFGPPGAGADSVAVSEYKALYTTFIPNTGIKP